MRRALLACGLVALAGCLSDSPVLEPDAPSPSLARAAPPTTGGLLPDLQTVVPQHLQLVRSGKQDLLRFSNGIANTGAGPLHLAPAFPLDGGSSTQGAIQWIFDASGAVVRKERVSEFEYHPEHNHWHISAVALYEVRKGSPTGAVVGANSVKTTFCLIDWYALDGNSKTPNRAYWDCNQTAAAQGISVGWVDQYNHAVEGQALDLAGAPGGTYYLVSTANPDGTFLEQSRTNNTAWTSFALSRDKRGNPKIQVLGTSPCTGSLCGSPPNR